MPSRSATLPAGASRCWKSRAAGASGAAGDRLARLIEQHGDMRLPELRYILAGDCPHADEVSISEQCSVYYPQLRRE